MENEVVNTETVEQVVNTENAEPSQTTETVEPSEKTFTQAELDDIIQKRLDRERKKLDSDPRLSFVETQAKRYGMSPEQYIEAVRQAEEQERLNELVQQNIPEEYAKEMLENRKFREQYESERQSREQQEKKQNYYKEFIEAYPDVKPEEIPQSVWQEFDKGKSLVDAYAKHENQLLKTKLAEFQQKQEIEQQKKQNADSTPGSLTGNGQTVADFISKEVYEANKKDQSWLLKNYDKVKESMRKW